MPRAFGGQFSPDGKRIAYEELPTAFVPDWYEISFWRHYRGGRTHPVRIMDLANYSVEKLPWKDSNDSDPMWIGNTVYFMPPYVIDDAQFGSLVDAGLAIADAFADR